MELEQFLYNFIARFKHLASPDLLPLKKLSELTERKYYVIYNLMRLETSIGDGILTTVSEEPFKDGHKPTFQILLPPSFINDQEIGNWNDLSPGTYCLYIIKKSLFLLERIKLKKLI